ncbi:MAG: hypothetical protein BGO69_00550 [Bacteroidetes bacterium 46-16]|nr:MAG: hypothetical protein BGO69_00550 [Bacteroidetes bacterium 46-16]
MKFIILITLFVLSAIPKIYAQIGPVAYFDYDNAGNRIRRYQTIAQLKPGPADTTDVYTADTIKEQFNLNTAKGNVEVIAYPNPVTTALVVENKNWQAGDKAELKLYDIAGKLLRAREATCGREVFYFGDIASGVYTVFYYLNGKQLTNWKVIKNTDN